MDDAWRNFSPVTLVIIRQLIMMISSRSADCVMGTIDLEIGINNLFRVIFAPFHITYLWFHALNDT